MQTGNDVVVVGGGLVGWSAAYHLAHAGMKVTLVDRSDQGQATAAGAGIISPGSAVHMPERALSLSHAAVTYYPRLLALLAEDGEHETGYATPGVIFVFTSEEEYARMPEVRRFAEARKAAGTPNIGDISLLDGPAAREVFPPLADIPGALYMPDAARVDGRLLRDALRRASEKRGVRVVQGSAELVREGDQVARVNVNGEALSPGSVLIAGGAWSPAIGEQLGVRLPIYPQRGQIIHLDVPETDTSRWTIIHGFHNHYLLTFPSNRVVVGATREDDSGFDYRMTAGGVHQELGEALRVAPGLASATIAEIRIGFRPASRDAVPILGRVPGIRNTYVATGHGPSGLQMGPVSAVAVADLILNQPPAANLELYRPDRFVTDV